jgi:hypothetical protein
MARLPRLSPLALTLSAVLTTASAALAEPPAESDPLGELRREMAAQRAGLEAQRKKLDAQAAELASLREARAAAPVDPGEYEEKLRFYGFMDMGLQRMFLHDPTLLDSLFQSRAATFTMGNINFYVDARPFEHWRALVEARLSAFPNGQIVQMADPLGHAFQQTNTNVTDVNSPNGGWDSVKWGGVVLERAHLDWSPKDWLNVRVGYWPTPYGIWNVDHGTPTLISVMLPQFMATQIFPTKQLGLDLYGTLHASSWEIEYHAYVSNGRTQGQLDLTDDKMIGGRLVARTRTPTPMAFGISGFWGKNSFLEKRIESYSPYLVDNPMVWSQTEGGGGADVSLDWKGFRFRAEASLQKVTYAPGKREPGPFPGSYNPDRVRYGAYVIASYQLPFWGLEPYLYAETDRNLLALTKLYAGSFGLNIHFTPQTQLKLQASALVVPLATPIGSKKTDGVELLASRLVVAF